MKTDTKLPLVIIASLVPAFICFFLYKIDNFSSILFVTANVLGFMGMTLFLWEMLLGVRFLTAYISSDITYINRVHSFIGKYSIILILLHPFLEMFSYVQNLLWIFLPSLKSYLEVQISFGRLAVLAYLVIWLSSVLIRKKMSYRPWLYLHYLSYPIVLFSFIHALNSGTFIKTFLLIKALWITLFIVFVILSAIRVAIAAGYGKLLYKVSTLVKQTDDLFFVTLLPVDKYFTVTPGQYANIQIERFGESHPLTVLHYNKDDNSLTFAVKVVGNFSTQFANVNEGDILLLDGAYGNFTQESDVKKHKIILSGGVGITPFVDFIAQANPSEVVLIASYRKKEDKILHNYLQRILNGNYYCFLSQDVSDDTNTISGRVTKEILFEIAHKNDFNDATYYICGSKVYIKGIEHMLIEELQVPAESIITEKFS